MENRNGLLTDFRVTKATGAAERDAVPTLLGQAKARGFRPRTLGEDKNYDTRECVAAYAATRRDPPTWLRTPAAGAAPSTDESPGIRGTQ